jgi:hypothetical protein
MPPDMIEGRPPGNGDGPQGSAIALARDCSSPDIETPPATQEVSPVDRRTSTSDLPTAVRDVRIRLARNEIHAALRPVSRHVECALDCLELDDDVGLQHHLGHVVDAVRNAARRHKELRSLLAAPARELTQ